MSGPPESAPARSAITQQRAGSALDELEARLIAQLAKVREQQARDGDSGYLSAVAIVAAAVDKLDSLTFDAFARPQAITQPAEASLDR